MTLSGDEQDEVAVVCGVAHRPCGQLLWRFHGIAWTALRNLSYNITKYLFNNFIKCHLGDS